MLSLACGAHWRVISSSEVESQPCQPLVLPEVGHSDEPLHVLDKHTVLIWHRRQPICPQNGRVTPPPIEDGRNRQVIGRTVLCYQQSYATWVTFSHREGRICGRVCWVRVSQDV